MASLVGNNKLSYQILQKQEDLLSSSSSLERAIKKARLWLKVRTLGSRRRPKLGVHRLKRFLRKYKRRCYRFVISKFRIRSSSSSLSSLFSKALKKMKDGQSHMNDLFGGNYMFMQYNNPSSFRYSHALHGLPSTTNSIIIHTPSKGR